VLLATPAIPARRAKMTVRLSYDECESWPMAKVIHKGSAAYSDLTVSHDLNGLLFYEADYHAGCLIEGEECFRAVLFASDGQTSPR
jgi:hypothetical protein